MERSVHLPLVAGGLEVVTCRLPPRLRRYAFVEAWETARKAEDKYAQWAVAVASIGACWAHSLPLDTPQRGVERNDLVRYGEATADALVEAGIDINAEAVFDAAFDLFRWIIESVSDEAEIAAKEQADEVFLDAQEETS